MAKNVFQLQGAAADGAVVFCKKLSRPQFHRFMKEHPRCVVAMEACGGARHWAREMDRLGHEVRLIAPRSRKESQTEPPWESPPIHKGAALMWARAKGASWKELWHRFDRPWSALFVGYALSLPYNILASVGVWRSAERYEAPAVHAEAARIATLVVMLVLSMS